MKYGSADAAPGVAVLAGERRVCFDIELVVERGHVLDVHDFAVRWSFGTGVFDQDNYRCRANVAAALCDCSHD